MRTKEFITEVKKLGFKVNVKNIKDIWIDNSNGSNVAYVSRYRMYEFDTAFLAFEITPESHKVSLFNLLICYARTPLEEREYPQKFYLQLTTLIAAGTENYLNYNTINGSFLLSGRWQTPLYQTQFTQAEIDEMKEKFGDALSGFEKIPVDEVKDEEIE